MARDDRCVSRAPVNSNQLECTTGPGIYFLGCVHIITTYESDAYPRVVGNGGGLPKSYAVTEVDPPTVWGS